MDIFMRGSAAPLETQKSHIVRVEVFAIGSSRSVSARQSELGRPV